ncbi:MAG: TetR family transcriptional regulator [Candidatus Izemoplasmatales bacterium]|jgi:AcrR family transcriptional regulator|nr:TetR family transcriptional regulator [Candidatus Izemoplasmatales bacterium]
MPFDTFYNLPEEKRRKIIDSAVKEFSDNPFSEVSINKIVKNSEISRGSFYTYFADKYDLLIYLLATFKENVKRIMEEAAIDRAGDLKQLIMGLHKYIFDLYQNETNQKFIFNVLIYFQTHLDEELKNKNQPLPDLANCDDVFQLLDLKQFKFTSEPEIKQTIDIAFSILKTNIYNTVSKKLNFQNSKKSLEEYLNILEYGYRGNKNA